MKQRRRNEVRSCGQHDLVEWRVLGPAMVAIAHSGLDIGEAQAVQALFGLCAELLDDFHAVHLACELSEDRRLITKAGADLEHDILGTDVEQIRHQRYNEGLGDRLLPSDRKRHVRIGQWLKLDRHEFVSRDLGNCRHDAFVKARLAGQFPHPGGVGGDFRDHMLTQDLQIFGAHRFYPAANSDLWPCGGKVANPPHAGPELYPRPTVSNALLWSFAG